MFFGVFEMEMSCGIRKSFLVLVGLIPGKGGLILWPTKKISPARMGKGDFGLKVDNGFDQNPHKHYIFKASAHGLNAKKAEKVFNRRNIG